MQTNPINHDQIHYNAADQLFEARVTVHAPEGSRTYACSVPGDLATPLHSAATALRDAALHRHVTAPGLYSAQASLTPAPLRATARPTWRKRLMRALPLIRRAQAA